MKPVDLFQYYQCKKCDYFVKVNEQRALCPFVRCIQSDGWLADRINERLNEEKKDKNNGTPQTM